MYLIRLGFVGACPELLVKMPYEEEVAEVFGEAAVNVLLEAVDDGDITLDQGQDIARKLNSKVGGKLRQRRTSVNSFEFDRGAMRDILGYYYQFCCPENEGEEADQRQKLLDVLRDDDLGMKSLAKKIADC